MRIHLRGDRIAITDAMRSYVEKKVSRLRKYFEGEETGAMLDIRVVFSVQRELHRSEITMQLPGFLLRAEVSSDDMYASIDSAVDKIERQIRKYKTRMHRKPRHDVAVQQKKAIEGRLEQWPPSVPGIDDEEEIQIVRTKHFPLKPMNEGEAVLQMELLGHSFFVFSDDRTGRTSVVYRRRDGRYGLISPGGD
ncbi:ribosome hibernation-promoting factor, HPF/YfiA family [Pasteuria penetrans]|uniref:ribosome hibernation-promoting factor, HPF/YfiA family n=1 Tax=Pasteuria penetrans TaxID=86005 RepID=UPI000F9B9022|nr:ribosome-associated translation inhibitor RaiA [Pasteuria penetrans]